MIAFTWSTDFVKKKTRIQKSLQLVTLYLLSMKLRSWSEVPEILGMSQFVMTEEKAVLTGSRNRW